MHKICSIIMLTNKLFLHVIWFSFFILPIFFKNKCTSLTYWYLILFIFVVLLCSSSMSTYPCTTLISHGNLQENYRMGGSFVWPTVAKVAEYRKKVRKAILDVIDNTPLELPVTQESKWVRTTKTHMTEQWTLNHCWEIWRFAENSWQLARLQLSRFELGNVLHRGFYMYMVVRRWILFSSRESNILWMSRASV